MPGVTEEQVRLAREVDLLSYLQANEPHELRRTAPGEYRTATHSSLVISKGKWIWNRGGIGGKTALDYLIKIRGMGFVEAVETILGSRAALISYALPVERKEPPPKQWPFYPPKPCRYGNRAVAYLQQRGISPDVIKQCIQAGILYESRYYNPQSEYHNVAVCVFAGKDESGKIVFATMRGIDTDFKQDKAGSDKSRGFCVPAPSPDSTRLAVFEAPIDLLSHMTLEQRSGAVVETHRLSLGGTSDVALIAFLERNPQIEAIDLCLDNDDAGRTAAQAIQSRLAADERFAHIRTKLCLPCEGKDYNETLLRTIQRERDPPSRPNNRAAISI